MLEAVVMFIVLLLVAVVAVIGAVFLFPKCCILSILAGIVAIVLTIYNIIWLVEASAVGKKKEKN